MVTSDVPERLAAAARAMKAGDWSAAKHAFETVLEQHESPEALAGLGDALWWLGETENAIRHQERAYAAFRRRSDPARAGLAAIALYFLFRVSLGNTAASRGWLGRAARLVDDSHLERLTGWIMLLRAHDTDDPSAAEVWARQAGEMALRFDDPDLELCALSQVGAALVQMGRVVEGEALLDEAMAASLGGEGERLETVVYTSCNMISACSEIAEVGRATQWIHAADGFIRRYGSLHLFATCRSSYARVLFATGDWAGAQRELDAALRIGDSAERALHGEALATLAEVRLAQGHPEEAERLLEGFEDHFTSNLVLASIRLAQGDPDAARRIARRRLNEIDSHRRPRTGSYRPGAARSVEAAALWELLAAVEIVAGSPKQALVAARRLEALARTSASDLISARSMRTVGLALANDPSYSPRTHGDARAYVEKALELFAHLGMPFEMARSHLLLARIIAVEHRAEAIAEAGSALSQFVSLGAVPGSDEAVALLRSLGANAARHAPRGTGHLTRREGEVLELLGEGLSNRQIADRLFVTRKTVEHHVANVLAKLSLRSRSEATAYAVRHQARDLTLE